MGAGHIHQPRGWSQLHWPKVMLDSITALPERRGKRGTAKPICQSSKLTPGAPQDNIKHILPKCSSHRPPLCSIPSGVSRGAELRAHPGCKNLPGTDLDQGDEFLTSSETTNHSRATTIHIPKNRTYQPCCFSADKSVFSHLKVKKCLRLIPHTKT